MPHRDLSARRLAALVLTAATLAGCGTSGYGTVDAHQLVLIPTALSTSPAARRAEAALICGARAEARRLHHALRVAHPRNATASAQIAVTNAVAAKKPGGVLIVPAARDAMIAPILSLRRAGIRLVRLSPPREPPSAAATASARAVVSLVTEIEHGNRSGGPAAAIRLLAPCASAH